MAELTFSKLYTDNSTGLSDVCIGNEPDNVISKFFVEAQGQCNDLGNVTLSNYDAIKWKRSTPLMASQNITKLGIKTFPQIGSIGFFKLKYEPKSLVIAPIHSGNRLYAAPLLTVTERATEWHIHVTNPSNVKYDCFRIVVRNGYFAEEYVTYEEDLILPVPLDMGLYAISAFGYINELCASVESQIVDISVIHGDVAVLADESGNALLIGDTILLT